MKKCERCGIQYEQFCPVCDNVERLLTTLIMTEIGRERSIPDVWRILQTVKHRAKGKLDIASVKEVVLAPYQFSGMPYIRKNGTMNNECNVYKCMVNHYYGLPIYDVPSKTFIAQVQAIVQVLLDGGIADIPYSNFHANSIEKPSSWTDVMKAHSTKYCTYYVKKTTDNTQKAL